MRERLRNILDGYVRKFLAPAHRAVVVAAILATLGSVWIVSSQWNLDSSLEALLPRDSESARALAELDRRVGSTSSLFVVLDSPDTDANLEFARDYAERLREIEAVSLAHFHNDRTFFENHASLYFDADKLAEIREKLDARIERAKRKANPLFVSLDDEDSGAEDGGGGEGSSLEESIAGEKDDFAYTDYKEYLISDDGYAVTIVVRFAEASSGITSTNRLLDKVRSVGRSLEPSSYHPEMDIQLGGGLVARQNSYESIVDDVQISAIVTFVGIFILIALYFRRIRATLLVLSPLVMGAVWTLALAFLAYDQLTSITTFIFAVILGLGIDYGIHLLSSYDEKRARGASQLNALARAFSTTGRATTLGAVTTFATFLVIAFSQFRGLAEFGTVAAGGVLCTLVATLVVLPSLVLWVDRAEHDAAFGLASSGAAGFEERELGISAGAGYSAAGALALAVTAASLFALPHLGFEENFHRIGDLNPFWQTEEKSEDDTEKTSPADSARRAASDVGRRIEERAVSVRKALDPETFKPRRQQTSIRAKYNSAVSDQMSSMPTVLLFDSKREARRVYRKMAEYQRKHGFETIAAVDSIYAFLPGSDSDQTRRLDEIAKLRETLDGEDLSVLSDDLREKIERFRKSLEVDQPVDAYDLPLWTKRFFREAGPAGKPAHDGEPFAFEYTVFVHSAVDLRRGDLARKFLKEIRESAGDSADYELASQAAILVALLDKLQRSGPRLVGIGLLIVFLLVAAALRSFSRGLAALLPLGFGLFWTLGLVTWLGLRLDIFNVVILPAIIGIGIDDGIHFYARYLELGRGSLGATMKSVGTTILMTSLTSSVGFGGLALAEYEGVRSIGILAAVGILTMLLATVTVLPLALAAAERLGFDAILPEDGGEALGE